MDELSILARIPPMAMVEIAVAVPIQSSSGPSTRPSSTGRCPGRGCAGLSLAGPAGPALCTAGVPLHNNDVESVTEHAGRRISGCKLTRPDRVRAEGPQRCWGMYGGNAGARKPTLP